MKVVTIIGTRPEIIRLSRTIAQLDASTEHILIHTGQNYDYELNNIFFDTMGIRPPDYYLDCAIDANSAAQVIANVIHKTDQLLRKLQPDCVVILGDTNSCLSAISAKKLRIPIFHIEAGNRCFDDRVPEETNRRLVDHISDVNITYSHISRENLVREGFSRDRIIVLGSPMQEVYHYYDSFFKASEILINQQLTDKSYFVFSCHREENLINSFKVNQVLDILNKLAEIYELPIIVSTHPRMREVLSKSVGSLSHLVRCIKPISFPDFVRLQKSSLCVISDSGGINEESLILGFNAVNMRDTHERQEATEEGGTILTGTSPAKVLEAVEYLIINTTNEANLRTPASYCINNFSTKVVRVIMSYTDYINKYVYHS